MSFTPTRPSTLSAPNSGRQSPFKRQNSISPATATTPTQSPTKAQGSLSPEKSSPFVRQPSRNSQTLSEQTSRQHGCSLLSGPRTDELRPESPSPFDGAAAIDPRDRLDRYTQATAPVATQLSSQAKVKAPILSANMSKPAVPKLAAPGAGYNHVPPALLRSMRESFEVLDGSNSGAITAAAVRSMLEQMGLDAGPTALRDFFPSHGPAQLNLARYLDALAGPLAALSPPDELAAAFGAFDVDDSGQIDVAELRRALMETAPEPGDEDLRLDGRELDDILGQFASRRAFGAKGLNVAKGKGEVFRYRDFMSNVSGGGAEAASTETVVV